MTKTLARHGNSLALVIDKAILELLNIGPETPLEISTDGRALIVEPVTDPTHKRRVKSAIDKANRKYAKALERLAK